jgi:hypothetical protein
MLGIPSVLFVMPPTHTPIELKLQGLNTCKLLTNADRNHGKYDDMRGWTDFWVVFK